MFLSRIQLTSSLALESQLGLLLQDRSYGLHRLLWDLFPQGERFLYREETEKDQYKGDKRFPLYFVLSPVEPQKNNALFEVNTKVFAPKLEAGDVLAFKLRANPTVSRMQKGVKNSRRHDVVMDAQKQFLMAACKARELPVQGKKSALKALLFNHPDFNTTALCQHFDKTLKQQGEQAAHHWLESRAKPNGFTLGSVQVTGYRWHALPEKGRNAGFSTMDYEGVLTVTNPEQFVASVLYKGLGPSKAFGCGLVMIRR